MSYETTMASARARAAEHDWKYHRLGCPPAPLAPDAQA